MNYKKSEWKGYTRYDFQVNGHDCLLIVPKKVAVGKPWVWRAEFFDAFAYADMALLAEGWHIAYCDLHDRFGSADAVAEMKNFHDTLTAELGLAKKADLFGFSRGGLYGGISEGCSGALFGCACAGFAKLAFRRWRRCGQ